MGATSWSRPFRALIVLSPLTQGAALGWHGSHLWCSEAAHSRKSMTRSSTFQPDSGLEKCASDAAFRIQRSKFLQCSPGLGGLRLSDFSMAILAEKVRFAGLKRAVCEAKVMHLGLNRADCEPGMMHLELHTVISERKALLLALNTASCERKVMYLILQTPFRLRRKPFAIRKAAILPGKSPFSILQAPLFPAIHWSFNLKNYEAMERMAGHPGIAAHPVPFLASWLPNST